MSVDQIGDQPPLPAFDVDRPIEADRLCDASSEVVGEHLPRAVVVTGGSTETVDALLLSVARGNQEAFVTLQSRMAGLVRVNVRRVLRDASRSEAVTQETFAEVLDDAIHFDPHRDSAQTWLLTRAHQHAMDGLRSVDGTDDSQGPRIDQSTSDALSGVPVEFGDARSSASSPARLERSLPDHPSLHDIVDHGRRQSWVSASESEHSS